MPTVRISACYIASHAPPTPLLYKAALMSDSTKRSREDAELGPFHAELAIGMDLGTTNLAVAQARMGYPLEVRTLFCPTHTHTHTAPQSPPPGRCASYRTHAGRKTRRTVGCAAPPALFSPGPTIVQAASCLLPCNNMAMMSTAVDVLPPVADRPPRLASTPAGSCMLAGRRILGYKPMLGITYACAPIKTYNAVHGVRTAKQCVASNR
jgi:hypothetical protein